MKQTRTLVITCFNERAETTFIIFYGQLISQLMVVLEKVHTNPIVYGENQNWQVIPKKK